jgi:hypothetical protein
MPGFRVVAETLPRVSMTPTSPVGMTTAKRPNAWIATNAVLMRPINRAMGRMSLLLVLLSWNLLVKKTNQLTNAAIALTINDIEVSFSYCLLLLLIISIGLQLIITLYGFLESLLTRGLSPLPVCILDNEQLSYQSKI